MGISREDGIALVHGLAHAVNSRDMSAISDFYAPNAVVISPAFHELRGRDAIVGAWERMLSTFPDWKVSITDVLVDGDRIAALGINAATDRQGWFGFPPTGGLISYRAVLLLTIAQCKIVHEERLYDISAVLEHLEKARVDQELRTAAELQSALLSRAGRLGRHYEAIGDSVPCRTIGGDFFEFIELPSGEFGIALGDVIGKGPPAALLAAMLQGMFAVEARSQNSPSTTMSRMNRALADRGLRSQFATLFYGILAPDGRFAYSNGGHNPPIVLSNGQVRRLTAGGPILGAFQGAAFDEETLYLNDRDVVVLFSDGVTEARNSNDEEFGESRLISCVTAHGCESAPTITTAVLDAVRAFCDDAPQTDDITITVTRYRVNSA